jgi:hypothetical protein
VEMVKPKLVALFVAVACIVGMVFGSVFTSAFLNVRRAIPSTGMVSAVNVEVYSDGSCTQNLTSIDWGSVYPGGSVSRMVYVKNTGNVPLTLSLTTASWNPISAAGQISVTWDKDNTVLNAGQSTAATLTLSVSQSISGVISFSVNVVITGSG